MRQLIRTHRPLLLKTASYYLVHMLVAITVAYVVTRNLWAALTLSLVEPAVQTIAYVLHEKAWSRAPARSAPPTATAGGWSAGQDEGTMTTPYAA